MHVIHTHDSGGDEISVNLEELLMARPEIDGEHTVIWLKSREGAISLKMTYAQFKTHISAAQMPRR